MNKMKKSSKTPPALATQLLKLCSHDDGEFHIIATLHDLYSYKHGIEGKRKADLWCWRQVLWSIPKNYYRILVWRLLMIKNYLKIAFRNVRKYKGYSFINVLGLTIGMTCCMFILLWVQDEFSYDRFHKKAKNIYRVLTKTQRADGSSYLWTGTPGLLASTLQAEVPEVEKGVHIVPDLRCRIRYDDKKFYKICCATESTFFDIFSFPFIQGNAQTALESPGSIVLTETAATKYFGNDNPLGKNLNLNFWIDHHLKVTGVIKDVPHNSHLQFDCLIHFSVLKAVGWDVDVWGGTNYQSYILLDSNTEYMDVENKTKYIYKQRDTTSKATIQLEPILRMHLHNPNGGGLITYIAIFTTLAILILLIACINFMNLSTARASTKAKEVGVRKVFGVNRLQLRLQFLGESIFMAYLALILAIIFARLFLPYFNNIAGKQLTMNFSIFSLIGFIMIALITGIISGIYPAAYLSSFQPQKILKGTIPSSKKTPFLRKGLVVFQFTVSIFLIISATIIFKQLEYIRKKDLGFDKEHVLYLETIPVHGGNYETFKRELLQNPNVVALAMANSSFLGMNSSTTAVRWEGMPDNHEQRMLINSVDFDYKNTLGLKISSGRFFSRDHATDMREGIVVNEEAVNAMGIEDPVGKKFFCPTPAGSVDGTIIGVLKNFHVSPLHSPIEPLAMVIVPRWYNRLYIRIRPDNIPRTLAFIEQKTREIAPEYILEYSFLDDRIDNLYKAEIRLGKISQVLTGLSIFISCLGLFGLVAFTSELRTKEIGIRKVLGASVLKIIGLLSRDFLIWVLLANLFAWPSTFYFLNKWLGNFAYRTDLSIWIFILSGLTALSVALLTVIYLTIRAALANPVDSLRYE